MSQRAGKLKRTVNTKKKSVGKEGMKRCTTSKHDGLARAFRFGLERGTEQRETEREKREREV